jgi:hypothetical protein
VRKTGEQTAFSTPVISSAGTAVGAQAMFSNAGRRTTSRCDSERLVEEIDVPQPCGQNPDSKPVQIPNWVADLISSTK